MALGSSPLILLLIGGLVGATVGGAAFEIGHRSGGSEGSAPMDMADRMPGDMSMDPGMSMDPDTHHHMAMTALDLIRPMDWNPDVPPDLTHPAPFPLEATGAIPTLDEAQQFSHKYSKFVVVGNQGLQKLRAEGYFTGSGTPASPYVLQDFYVTGELSITSTNESLVLKHGYVGGQLKLDYVGESLYVHHVHAEDLRVNENVKRTGPNTGGLFEHDSFAFVGQIRHFVGEFRTTTIGPKPQNVVAEYLADEGVSKVANEVVFNFDGFHRADVHDNVFIGEVDIKLHGHNHGDCFTCPVHDHTDLLDAAHQGHTIPNNTFGFQSIHSVRYSSLAFHDNEIHVPSGIALRYNDRNHAGDDRTANSEPNPHVNDNHVHFEDITIRHNQLVGGQLLVDVFDAADDHHPVQDRGILRIWDNDVEVHYSAGAPTQTKAVVVDGMKVQSADGLELSAERNHIHFVQDDAGAPAAGVAGALGPKIELRGFDLATIDASNLTIRASQVDSGRYGVWAQAFTATTFWKLTGNHFQTTEPWKGQNIQNPPEEQP